MAKILDKEKLDEVVTLAFLHNKKAENLHVTPDGNCFFDEDKGHAINHAKLIQHASFEAQRVDYVKEGMQEAYDKWVENKAAAEQAKRVADEKAKADAKAQADADAKAKADADTKASDDAKAKLQADLKAAADEAAAEQAKTDAITKATQDLEAAKTGGDEKVIADAQAALDALTKADDTADTTKTKKGKK